MRLFVDLDTQTIVQEPLVRAPGEELTVPRTANAPIQVQFIQNNEFVDPEVTLAATLGASTTGAGAVFNSPGHGFEVGQGVSISGHVGKPTRIVSVVPQGVYQALVTTLGPHGMTALGNGKDEYGVDLAAGKYLVTISGTSGNNSIYAREGTITSTSVTTPGVVTTTSAHGLTTGDIVYLQANNIGTYFFTVTVLSSVTFSISTAENVIDGVQFVPTAVAGTNIYNYWTLFPTESIDRTFIANFVSATTFWIDYSIYSRLTDGTVSVSATVPDANTSIGQTRTITAVTENTFTIGALTLTAAGIGGTATGRTDLDMRWTVKADGDFDGPVLAGISPGSFRKYGTGASTLFKGSCNYLTVELNSLLGIDLPITGSFSVAGSVITATGHGLTEGDTIVFTTSATIPAGLVAGQTYYVSSVPSVNTLTVSATSNGPTITTTSGGSGTLTFVAYSTSDDAEEAECMAELSWTGAYPSKTNWITHKVRNDLYKISEASPVTTGGYDGKSDIGSGVDFLSVTFPTPLASANWHFLGTPMITNTTLGNSALGLDVVALTARTTAGFTVYFSGQTNASTYDLEWQVRLD